MDRSSYPSEKQLLQSNEDLVKDNKHVITFL